MTNQSSTENKVLYPTAYVGSFGVYYNREERLVLVFERGDRAGYPEGLGVPGGYMDIGTTEEQPRENAVREFREEIILPDGSPVLQGIAPERLVIVDSGFDYKAAIPGTNHKGTCWNAFKCAITADETAVLKSYVQRMAADAAFADTVRKKSNGELKNVFLLSADDLLSRESAGTLLFRYDHEKRMTLQVARALVADMSHPAPLL